MANVCIVESPVEKRYEKSRSPAGAGAGNQNGTKVSHMMVGRLALYIILNFIQSQAVTMLANFEEHFVGLHDGIHRHDNIDIRRV